MWGFQATGAAPLVLGHPVLQPETVATAIRIGNPASAEQAQAARDESGGLIEAVSDQQILDAQAFLAREEGIFVEPASAAGMRVYSPSTSAAKSSQVCRSPSPLRDTASRTWTRPCRDSVRFMPKS